MQPKTCNLHILISVNLYFRSTTVLSGRHFLEWSWRTVLWLIFPAGTAALHPLSSTLCPLCLTLDKLFRRRWCLNIYRELDDPIYNPMVISLSPTQLLKGHFCKNICHLYTGWVMNARLLISQSSSLIAKMGAPVPCTFLVRRCLYGVTFEPPHCHPIPL